MFFNNPDDYFDLADTRLDDDVDNSGEYEMEVPCANCPAYNQMANMYRSPDPNTPPGPPPMFTPNQAQTKSNLKEGYGPSMGPSVKAVDPGSIRMCKYTYVYIWQSNGRSYWAYITYVGRRSIAGYRWMGFRWVYFGLDLRQIDSFYCL